MTGKSHLSDLTNEERDLIIGLPYRVGVWMGNAEDEGGDEDDAREMVALEKILADLAKMEKVPAFVRELLKETLSRRERWPDWADDTFDILPDCKKAVDVLEAKSGKADRSNFKKTLKKIALQVAGAYGEFGDFDNDEGKGFVGRLIGKIKGADKAEDFMNISPGEEEALRNLAEVLGKSDGE